MKHFSQERPLFTMNCGKDMDIVIELNARSVSVSGNYCYVVVTDGKKTLLEGSPTLENALAAVFEPCKLVVVTVYEHSGPIKTIIGYCKQEF